MLVVLLCASDARAQEAPPALAAADAAMRQGRYEDAARQYETWLATRPDTPEVLFALGVCRIQMGRSRDAVAVLRRYVELAPRAANGHAALGVALMDAASPADARLAFQQALSLDPSLPGAIEGMARLLLIDGDPKAAAALLRPIAGAEAVIRPSEEVKVLFAESLMQSGASAEAAAALEADIAAAPDRSAQTFALACLARIAAGELERAALTCEQGMRRHPDSEIEGVYLTLPPNVLADRTAARLAAIQKASDPREMIALGRVLTDVDPTRQTRAADLARQLLGDAVALDPASASARYNLGRVLARGDMSAAIAEWERALSLNPDPMLRVQIYTQIAKTKDVQSDVAGARAAFAAALEINRRLPRRIPEPALEFVRFERLHGQAPDAEALLDEIIGWSPWAPEARVERARLLADAGRWAEVAREGEFVLQHARGRTTLLRVAHLLLSRAYHRLGQLDKAQVHRQWLESH